MNFLAHLYLSGDNTELLIGNFIADSVKGKAHEKYPIGIQKGIILHRRIDTFTDTHAIVLQSCKRLWDEYRHYSPVIVDIFYDHYLAANWDNYSTISLASFAENCYRILDENKIHLPDKTSYMFDYMSKQNWLVNYAQIDGIKRTLTGMSKRTPFDSKMETAVESMIEYYADFKNEFELFFEELRNYVAIETIKLTQS